MGYRGFQTEVIDYMREHPDIDWNSPESNQILMDKFRDHEKLAGMNDKAIGSKIRTAKSAGTRQLGLDEQDDSVDVLGVLGGSLDASIAANDLDLFDDPDLTPAEIEQAVMVNGSAGRKPADEYLTIDGKIENPPPRETETPAPRKPEKRKAGRPVKMQGETVKFGFQLEKDLLKQFKHVLIDREDVAADLIREWIREYIAGKR